MNLIKQLCCFTLLSLAALNVFALQTAGATLTYSYIGNNEYKFNFSVVFKCEGLTTLPVFNLFTNCQSPSSTVYPLTFVSNSYPDNTCLATCSASSDISYRTYNYTANVTITSCNNVTVGVFLNDLSNSANLDTLTSLLVHTNFNPNTHNNSVVFTHVPIVFEHDSTLSEFNLSAYDKDGDSLVISLDTLKASLISNAVYSNNYSPQLPFGVTHPISYNVATETWSYLPDTASNYVCFKVAEYDVNDGSLKSTSAAIFYFKHAQISGINKSPYLDLNANVNSEITAVTSFFGWQPNILPNNVIEVCQGDSIEMIFVAHDSDLVPNCTNPSSSNNFCLRDNINLNIPTNQPIPGVSFQIVSTGNPITLSVKAKIDFEAESFPFIPFFVRDSYCPLRGRRYVGVKFKERKRLKIAVDDTLICSTNQQFQLTSNSINPIYWLNQAGDTIPVNAHFSCNPCNNPIASPDTATTYFAISSDTGLCFAIDSIHIAKGSVFEQTVSPDTVLCGINQVILVSTIDTAISTTISWRNSAGVLLSNSALLNITPFQSDVYYCERSTIDGCVKIDSTIVVVVPNSLISSADTIICGDSLVSIQINATDIGLDYYWKEWNGSSYSSPTSLSCDSCLAPVATIDSTAKYKVSIVGGYCQASTEYNVLMLNSTFNLIDSVYMLCDESSTANAYPSAVLQGAGVTYSWMSPSGTTYQNAASILLDSNDIGTWQLTATYGTNCTLSDNFSVQIQSSEVSNLFKLENIYQSCLNDTVELIPQIGDYPYDTTGQWGFIKMKPIPNQPLSSTNISLTNNSDTLLYTKLQIIYTKEMLQAAGIYSGLISGIGFDRKIGSISTMVDSAWIAAFPTSDTLFSSGSFLPFSGNYNGIFASKVVASGYNRFPFTNFFQWDGVSNICVQFIFKALPSTYGFTVPYISTNSFIYAGANSSQPIENQTSYAFENIYLPDLTFELAKNNSLSNYNFYWSSASGSSIVGPQNQLSVLLNTSQSDSVFLQVTDNSNGCSFTVGSQILPIQSSFNATIEGDNRLCDVNESAIYTLEGNFLSDVSWSSNVTSTGNAKQVIFNPYNQPENSVISATLGVGSQCETLFEKNVKVSTPIYYLSGDTFFCEFGSPKFVKVNFVNEPTAGFWNTNSNQSIDTIVGIQNSIRKNITFTYTSYSPCFTSASFDVIYMQPNTMFTLDDDTFCLGETNIGTFIPEETGGVFSGTGVTGNHFDPQGLAVGVYPVTYTLANQYCQGFKTINAYVRPAFDTIIVSQYPDTTYICNNEVVSFVFNMPLIAINWSNGSTLNSITIDTSTAGVYVVNAVDYNSCEYNAAYTVIAGPCATVEEELTSSNFYIYPNPVDDELNIVSGFVEKQHYDLLDITGKIMYSFYASGITKLNVENLSNGMYIIRSNSTNEMHKFLKF